MFTVTRQQTLGALKATGSSDPDVLFAAKEALLVLSRPGRVVTLIVMIAGGLLSLTIIGALAGLPALFVAWWLRRRFARNIRTADAAYQEYLDSLAAPSGALAAQQETADARA